MSLKGKAGDAGEIVERDPLLTTFSREQQHGPCTMASLDPQFLISALTQPMCAPIPLRQARATVSASVPTSTSHLRSPSSLLRLVSASLKALHHSPSSLEPNTDTICRATMHGTESAEAGVEGWEGY